MSSGHHQRETHDTRGPFSRTTATDDDGADKPPDIEMTSSRLFASHHDPYVDAQAAHHLLTPQGPGEAALSSAASFVANPSITDVQLTSSKGLLLQSLLAQRERLLTRLRTLPANRAARIFPIVRSGQIALLQTLLETKVVSIDERDYNQCTPLHVAAHAGLDEMVLVLLSYGADVAAVDKQGRTALDLAHQHGHGYVVKILIQAAREADLMSARRSTVAPTSANDSITGMPSGVLPKPMAARTRSVSAGDASTETPTEHTAASVPSTEPGPSSLPHDRSSRAANASPSGLDTPGGRPTPSGPTLHAPSRAKPVERRTHARTYSHQSDDLSTTANSFPDAPSGGVGVVPPPPRRVPSVSSTTETSQQQVPGITVQPTGEDYVPGFGVPQDRVELRAPPPPHHRAASFPSEATTTDPSGLSDAASPAAMFPLGATTKRGARRIVIDGGAAGGPASPTVTHTAQKERLSSMFTTLSDSVPVIICMVGLPGRGKSFISKHICRYMNWKGIPCRVFNAGDYRRELLGAESTAGADFYDPSNEKSKELREKMAELACEDAARFINSMNVAVAVLDATNTTRERRAKLVELFDRESPKSRLMFIESVCTRQDVIRENILRAKFGNKDFAGVTNPQEVIDSFYRRIHQYEKVYETLDDKLEPHLSYIRILNVKETIHLHNVRGVIPTRVSYYLLSLHPVAFPVYVSRHAETMGDQAGVFGGDSDVTPSGQRYALALRDFVLSRAATGSAPFTILYNCSCPASVATVKPLLDAVAALGSDTNVQVVPEPHDLDGVNYGTFFGLNREQANIKHPRMYHRLFGKVSQRENRLTGRQRPLIAPPPCGASAERAATILDEELAELQVFLSEPGTITTNPAGVTPAATPMFLGTAPGPGMGATSLASAMTSLSTVPKGLGGGGGGLSLGGPAIGGPSGHLTATNVPPHQAASGGGAAAAAAAGAGSDDSAAEESLFSVVKPPALVGFDVAPTTAPMASSPAMVSVGVGGGMMSIGGGPGAGGAGFFPPLQAGGKQFGHSLGLDLDAPLSDAAPAGGPLQEQPAAAMMPIQVTSQVAAMGQYKAGSYFMSHKYPAYNIGYPRGTSTRQVLVKLEEVLLTVVRCEGPILIVCPDAPARGLLAYMCDLAPEQTQYLRLPLHAVVEVGTKGGVAIAGLAEEEQDEAVDT